MWGGLGDRLANLGDAISQGATAHAKTSHEKENKNSDASTAVTTEGGTVVKMPPPPEGNPDDQGVPRWASNLGNWGTNILESTKHIVEETKQTLEKEQARIQANAPSLFSRGGPYKRDINLPLDVEALRDAEVVYITDRIVTLSHPYMQSTTDGDITPDRKLAAVGHLLQKRHGGRYMVWNLSEVGIFFPSISS